MSTTDELAAMRGAYVHIPFCSAVCPYCDFAVVAGADHLIGGYVDALTAEIHMAEPFGPLDAVFFGGGTPSHVPPASLGRVLDVLSGRHGIADGAEVTLEANPEDFSAARAGELAGFGFNRISFGAQSFDPLVLAALGRRHGPDQVETAVAGARDAFGSVSLDLIFGHPVETEGSWESTVRRAVDVQPSHVSCYALTVEPGTPLGRQVRAGAPAPDPDDQADRYEAAERLLAAGGFSRYEVSNWCRPGHECRYNLIVWAQGEYEAFGNGAHRFRDGTRSRNVRRLDAYIAGIGAGTRPVAGSDVVAGWERELDRLFVGLRMTSGVRTGPGGQALLDSGPGRRLAEAGVIGVVDDRLVVHRPLLTDEVHRAVLALAPPDLWVEAESANNV